MEIEGIETVEFNHSAPIQIRFNDIDVVGHVNNAVQIGYLDLGKVRYYEAVKARALNWHEAEFVMVNINVNFLEPIYMHEHIEVKTKITEIGNKSVKLVQVIMDTESGHIKTVAHSVMCGFDPKTCQSVPVSDHWRELINRFEQYRP